MKLESLRTETVEGRVRAVADVVWEDTPQASEPLFFEVPEDLGGSLQASPDAFALAAMPVALWNRERRLSVEGTLCPRLAVGMSSVIEIWGGLHARLRPLEIEATRGFENRTPRSEPRTSAFLSSGVDSLAMLRRNRAELAPNDPGSIRDAIVLFGGNGFEYANGRAVPIYERRFAELLERLAPLAEREALTLLPIRYNARFVLRNYLAWIRVGYGAMIASVAHLFPSRHSAVLLASSPIPGLASQPEFDPLFSSGAVSIRTGDAGESRLEKIRRIVDWEDARALVQPCWQRERMTSTRFNCGRCEKCIRTMLVLVFLGRLADFSAFEDDDVEPAWIRSVVLPTRGKLDALFQYREPLRRVGRHDLVRALEQRRRAFRRNQLRKKFRLRAPANPRPPVS